MFSAPPSIIVFRPAGNPGKGFETFLVLSSAAFWRESSREALKAVGVADVLPCVCEGTSLLVV